MKKNYWKPNIEQIDRPYMQYLARQFNVSPFVMKCLSHRNMKTEEDMTSFLYPSRFDLHDPFLLPDMKKAVHRILKAIEGKETIYLFGDYDCDGIASTFILTKGIKMLGGKVFYRLPTRNDGYGLSKAIVEEAKAKYNPSLLLTVDNGSSSHDAIRHAQKMGMDVCVTDHHSITDGHPGANCGFINPHRTDSTYPFPSLCGAGVAYKVVQALFLAKGFDWYNHYETFIEWAAFATIADMVPLVGENRVITSLGITKINHKPCPFFRDLIQKAAPYQKRVDANFLSFSIIPILNSIGRISNPNDVLPLAFSDQFCQNDIQKLIDINKERKKMTELQFSACVNQIQKARLDRHPIIMICDDFHSGILGILAARVSQKYQKPAFITNFSGRGSARSGPLAHYSLVNGLNQAAEYLISFGGHKGAAGYHLDVNHFFSFYDHMIQLSKSIDMTKTPVYYDAHLPFQHFPDALLDELYLLEPFGMENLQPTFLSVGTYFEQASSFGSKLEHIKFFANRKEAIYFSENQMYHEHIKDHHHSFLYSPVLSKTNHFFIHDLLQIADKKIALAQSG